MSASNPIADRRMTLEKRFPSWTPVTLDGWLDNCATQYGDRPLVITDDISFTYCDVAQRSMVIADALVALGVQPGDRVGMLMANYADFVPIKFAIARTGAVCIPFNFLYREEELGYVLAQSRCSVLITMTEFAGLRYLDMLDAIAPGWDDADFAAGSAANLPDLERVVVLSSDDQQRPGMMTLADLEEVGSQQSGASRGATHSPEDVADLLYTSGSTGLPKGVLVTHDAVLRTGYASALTRAYEDHRRILFSLPCYHMFGYVEGILSAMYVGGAVILLSTFTVEAYFDGIQRHRATDILCVPTMAVAMVQSDQREQYDLSSLTAILCGSTTAPIWLWERVEQEFGVSEIVTGYGMTECGGAMTLTLPEDELLTTSTTVGRPKLAGSAGISTGHGIGEYRTADPVTGEFLPDGEPGELISRGSTTMAGYWDKPEETASALRDGWLHSGDLGRVRDDGYLEVSGRSKELYKSGGELVMPKEIEELLGGLDAVSQVFAIGVPDDRWGEIGCVVIVPAPGASINPEAIIDHCRDHLARFKVPRQVLVLGDDELPKTATGKIQKYRLAELATRLREGQTS